NEDCLEVVTELGCESVQGFYVARPMRADLIESWVDAFAGECGRGAAGDRGREVPIAEPSDRPANGSVPASRETAGRGAYGSARRRRPFGAREAGRRAEPR